MDGWSVSRELISEQNHVEVEVNIEVQTSPKLLSCAQLLDSSDTDSPVAAEKESFTSGMDRQYADDLHNSSMHLHSKLNHSCIRIRSVYIDEKLIASVRIKKIICSRIYRNFL